MKKIQIENIIINNVNYRKKIFFILIILLIIIYSFIFSIIIVKNGIFKTVLDNKRNITQQIENNIVLNDNDCLYIKNSLKRRSKPLNFQNEFYFFVSLISCKIPFSFIRFGDGENNIMRGKTINSKQDNWHWNPKNQKFRESLIESTNICTNINSFIGIPCKNWINLSKSILSFSKCSSSKYMSYATLFINKNYKKFNNWISRFINTKNRWDIILIANSIINKNISWALKFFPIPDNIVEIWDKFSNTLLKKLSDEAKKNELIFFVSAGPAANIIISFLMKINNKNIYIDFGSSIEIITKGYSTRPYTDKNSQYSQQSCESFYIQNKTLIYD